MAGISGAVKPSEASLADMFGETETPAAELIDAENRLREIREEFASSDDAAVRSRLAEAALAEVERQLDLMRERRRLLDTAEGSLWGRRNRLERFLIEERGAEWWQRRRARRNEAPRAG